jgi:hypothetical protein
MNSLIRRKSTSLDVARTRCRGLMSQNPEMDLGNNMTIVNYQRDIDMLEAQLSLVNSLSASLQVERTKLRELEANVSDLNDRYMKATAAKFGTSSNEYQAIGGIRKKDKRRPSLRRTSLDTGVSTDQNM